MCDNCVEIDETIQRYRLLQQDAPDKQAYEAADLLAAKLEAKQAALHPEKE